MKGKLQVEASFRTALPSLTGFYARLLDDPPPYVSCLPLLSMLHERMCPLVLLLSKATLGSLRAQR